MAPSDDLYDDLYEYLRTEELKATFKRFRCEFIDQLGCIKAPRFVKGAKPDDPRCRPEAEQLWGPDKSQWRIHDLALQRALDKERQRGTPEDVLEQMPGALETWVQRGIEKYGDGRARKKSDLT
jgi:hypothetical protein